jgi:hypothetical protein
VLIVEQHRPHQEFDEDDTMGSGASKRQKRITDPSLKNMTASSLMAPAFSE